MEDKETHLIRRQCLNCCKSRCKSSYHVARHSDCAVFPAFCLFCTISVSGATRAMAFTTQCSRALSTSQILTIFIVLATCTAMLFGSEITCSLRTSQPTGGQQFLPTTSIGAGLLKPSKSWQPRLDPAQHREFSVSMLTNVFLRQC